MKIKGIFPDRTYLSEPNMEQGMQPGFKVDSEDLTGPLLKIKVHLKDSSAHYKSTSGIFSVSLVDAVAKCKTFK